MISTLARYSQGLTLILLSAYLILPTALVVVLSFGSGDVIRFPPQLASLSSYENFFSSTDWLSALLSSFLIAVGAATIATVAGTMAAFAITRAEFPGRALLEAATIAPLVVPEIVLAAGGYSIFVELQLVGSYAGVALMHAVLGVPYVVFVVAGAISRLDNRLEMASMTMGATPRATFQKITLPVLAPALLTGALFAFLVSFDDVVLSSFLIGTLDPTLPVKIFSSLRTSVSPVVTAVATLEVALAVLVVGTLAVARRLQAGRTRFA